MIDHPVPARRAEGMKLRHWCIESDRPDLQYRHLVTMDTKTQTFELPSWFDALTENAVCLCSPHRHFGSAWGEIVGNSMTIHASQTGDWHVLILAESKRVEGGNREVEFIPPNEPASVPAPPEPSGPEPQSMVANPSQLSPI